MSNKTKPFLRGFLAASILIISFAGTLGTASAQDSTEGLTISSVVTADCSQVDFNFTWSEGTGPYILILNFGNGDTTHIVDGIADASYSTSYNYLDQGEFEWDVQVLDSNGLFGSYSEILTLAGPQVTLSSDPFPALFLAGDEGSVLFTATVNGGSGNYSYAWDLDGDGSYEAAETEFKATGKYTEVGKYYPQVLITDLDMCGYTSSDTMPVVVANPEDACHPTAQKIADGVNTLFPNQAGDLYTCDDIYGIFDNESEENNLGFGRMWKAYHLAQQMEELTWEDILDWHLNQSGWGTLLQLDRFADLLADHSLPELMGLVISQEYKMSDVRTAVRAVTRYEADFGDALARIADGANPGELGQFYKLAADLEADVEVLDAYLAEGLTLAELKHTSKFADRMKADWTEIADARSLADSWGDINQAYHLATDEVSAAEILIMGVQDYKESTREEVKTARAGEDKQAEQEEAKTQQTAEKLAEQFSAEYGDVMSLLNGECQGEWSCVRSTLRDREKETVEGYSDKDTQTAEQIAFKYGYTEEEVLAYHKDYCSEDWACTRAYFREQYMDTKETGKPKK
jgi:hypothetical protein